MDLDELKEFEKEGDKLKAEWDKAEKIIHGDGDKGEERKPLLNSEDEKQEKFLDRGIRFLYVMLECCLPLIFKKDKQKETKDEKEDDKPVTKPPDYNKLTETKEVDGEVEKVVGEAEAGINEKLIEAKKGGTVHDKRLKIISYRTQITLGITYFTKIQLIDINEYFHARIYKPVEENSKAEVMGDLLLNKTKSDEIIYF